jgi:hypothetical protein
VFRVFVVSLFWVALLFWGLFCLQVVSLFVLIRLGSSGKVDRVLSFGFKDDQSALKISVVLVIFSS